MNWRGRVSAVTKHEGSIKCRAQIRSIKEIRKGLIVRRELGGYGQDSESEACEMYVERDAK